MLNPDVPGKPNRDRLRLFQQREAVADFYLRGLSVRVIAEKTGLSVMGVYKNLKKIEQSWHKAAVNARDRWLAEEIARINKIEAEAWEAWEKSKKDKTIRRVKSTIKGELKEITTESSAGDTSYLAVVEWCVDKRSKLRGLESLRVEVTGSGGGPVQLQETPRPADEAMTELMQMIRDAKSKAERRVGEMRMLPHAGLVPGDVPSDLDEGRVDDTTPT